MQLEGDLVGAMLLSSDWCLRPLTPVRQTLPMLCGDGARHGVGDEGKAVGCVPPAALLSFSWRCDQYKISKIKLSIIKIAVTPATESTKASLASL